MNATPSNGDPEIPAWGCILLICVAALCVTAWEIAKLIVGRP